MKKFVLLFLVVLFMILLLTMPEITNDGAIAGINLCIYSVIPALFPYILITNYLLSSDLYEIICSFFQPIIGRVLKISKYGSFVVVLGLLCGYPIGAKLLGELVTSKKISIKEGCYLITFCNNCSISFIVNYIFFTCLNTEVRLYKVLLLIYIPICLTALINRCLFNLNPTKHIQNMSITSKNPVLNSVKTLGVLCSYVFLFTIIAYFIKHLVPLNKQILYPIISFIEMTSGTALLSTTNTPNLLLFLCIAVLFGGLSTIFQTFALIPRYLKKYYILGKLEQIFLLLLIYPLIN